MNLPRVRFTLRRMMIAVAVVGIAIGGWLEGSRLLDRSVDYSDRAKSFSFLATQDQGILRDFPYIIRGLTDSPGDREYRAVLESRMRDVAARSPYLQAMSLKYRRAAQYPWLPVTPDPPSPR